MAVGELHDLADCISSSDDAIPTFRCTGRVFVIINVAIYIAPAHNSRCLDSYCSSTRSETERWRNSHGALTNSDPTLPTSLRGDAGPMPRPEIQWCG